MSRREADIQPAMDIASGSSPRPPCEQQSDDDGDHSELPAACDENIRIRAMDVMRTPKFTRVWQVSGIGERAAANCVDFARHEWTTVRRGRSRTASNAAATAALADTDAATTPAPPCYLKGNVTHVS